MGVPDCRRTVSSKMATIAYGDRVLLYEGFENQKVVTMTRGQVFQCRFGAFPHEYFVGKQFGSKVSLVILTAR